MNTGHLQMIIALVSVTLTWRDFAPQAPPATQPVSSLLLALAWNGQKYEAPEPLTIPPDVEKSDAYRQWWRVGDSRTIEWTDEAGRRCVADAWGRFKDERGELRPLIPTVSRYRADGTLEARTTNAPNGRPCEWSLFREDGRAKRIEVINRLSGTPGTPFVEYVTFYGADGKKEREYQANRYGIVYIEWFYDAKGEIDHWNGSSKLNVPPAASQPAGEAPSSTGPRATGTMISVTTFRDG